MNFDDFTGDNLNAKQDEKLEKDDLWDLSSLDLADEYASLPIVDKKHQRKAFNFITISLIFLVTLFLVGFAAFGVYEIIYGDDTSDKVEHPSYTQGSLTVDPYSSGGFATDSGGGNITVGLTAEQVSALATPSVVGIVVYNSATVPESISSGSGIIMSSDGYIITNSHVVDVDGTLIQVTLDDGTEYIATIVGIDSMTDLALLKIDATGLTAATFGDSDSLQVGQTVLAIGNPGGLDLANSVTQGIISAVGRSLTATSVYSFDVIQTDAAINPGNSGGPLVNMSGEVVAIVSSKISGTDYEGIGFAIPINEALTVIESLKEYGYVKDRVSLGISLTEITESMATTYGIPQGLMVSEIEDGSALKSAGVSVGDVITSFNGAAILDIDDLSDALEGLLPGDTVKLEVYRKSATGIGRTYQVTITLEEDK